MGVAGARASMAGKSPAIDKEWVNGLSPLPLCESEARQILEELDQECYARPENLTPLLYKYVADVELRVTRRWILELQIVGMPACGTKRPIAGWSSRSALKGKADEVFSGPDSRSRPIPDSTRMTLKRHSTYRYSMTSSARLSSVDGTVRPRALAVLRLITSSNRVGCSTGSSTGLAPFKTLST